MEKSCLWRKITNIKYVHSCCQHVIFSHFWFFNMASNIMFKIYICSLWDAILLYRLLDLHRLLDWLIGKKHFHRDDLSVMPWKNARGRSVLVWATHASKIYISYKTSQELRMLSNVTLDSQVTKIVMNSGSQLSEL